jgi:hypothetical protein
MKMNFWNKIFKGSVFNPPRQIVDAFELLFPNSINTEWSKNADQFEAIFYKDQVECIATFNKDAGLLVHKMYLNENYLPETIKAELATKGEIMNVVLINRGNTVTYEVIYRDKNLIRYVIEYDIIGGVVNDRKL